MKCFIRNDENEGIEVPNCATGAEEETPQVNFCYQPDEALSLMVQNQLQEYNILCTEDKPCFECQGGASACVVFVGVCLSHQRVPTLFFPDCDSDSQCYGPLRCFERTSENPLEPIPGCQGDGVHGKSMLFSNMKQQRQETQINLFFHVFQRWTIVTCRKATLYLIRFPLNQHTTMTLSFHCLRTTTHYQTSSRLR